METFWKPKARPFENKRPLSGLKPKSFFRGNFQSDFYCSLVNIAFPFAP